MQLKINLLCNFLQTRRGLKLTLLAFFLVNVTFYTSSRFINFPSFQKRNDASGFSYSTAEHFAYFHYYTGNFPLATTNTKLEYSKEGAEKEITENGENLIMEYLHWSRLGENARIWAFSPNAFISSSPENPSISLFNALVFTFSILILYFGFWRARMSLYGLILTSAVNLTPFFLYEVYTNQNIFALLGSMFFAILGLHIFSLLNKEKRAILLVFAIISGALVGFFSEYRNELSILISVLVLIYIFTKQQHFAIKLLSIVLCIATFYGSKQLIRSHFNQKFETTKALVEKHGGHVYNGGRISGHKFWHPVFCGLGDYDTKYGFEWNDKVAYRYAVPILQNEFKMDISYSDKYHLDNYYDADSLYYIKFDEIEEYEEIVKDKVLYHINDDPIWFVTIIFRRIAKTLTTTIPLPFIGWLLFFFTYYFVKNKEWFHLKLFVISLPLSATSILIYSGDGATYNSVFVYFVIMGLIWLLDKKYNILNKQLQGKA